MRTPAITPSSGSRRTAAAAVLLGLAAVLVPAGVAQAHVTLVASDPAERSVLAAPPSVVGLEMSAEVSFGSVVATDGCGRQLPGDVTVDGHLVDVVLPDAPAAPGAWVVSYELIAADGHLVGGQVRFTVAGDLGCEPVAAGDAEATEPAGPGAQPQGQAAPVDAVTGSGADDTRALPVGTGRVETVSTTSSTAPVGLAPGPAAALLVVVLSGAAVLVHRLHRRRGGAGA